MSKNLYQISADQLITFGQFIKEKRLSLDYTLRAFCRTYDYHSGNHSRMERDLLSPPANSWKRSLLATRLGLLPGTPDWDIFFDLANIASGRIPNYVLENPYHRKILQVVFRNLDNILIKLD